jgi:hypothetical protein
MAQDKKPFGYFHEVKELSAPQIQFSPFTQGVLDLGRIDKCFVHSLSVYLFFEILPNCSLLHEVFLKTL